MDEVYWDWAHSKVLSKAGFISFKAEDKNKQIMISKCKIISFLPDTLQTRKSSYVIFALGAIYAMLSLHWFILSYFQNSQSDFFAVFFSTLLHMRKIREESKENANESMNLAYGTEV